MKTSNAGLTLIKSFEGLHLICYADLKGIPTIGYGHTKGLTKDNIGTLAITEAQAHNYLVEDVAKAEAAVNKYDYIYHWTQDEFDALVSFAFNIGNIDQLTDKGTRSRDIITSKILEYNKCNKVEVAGLTRRRKAEQELFLSNKNSKLKGIMTFSLKLDGEVKISQHFKVKEFKCKDGSDKVIIDVDFVKNELEKIRNTFNKPVCINSAYRTPEYNNKVGGAANSYHMKGQAFDIVVNGETPETIAKVAYNVGCGGVIRYNTFVHVDSRVARYLAINNNGKVTKVTKF